MRHSPAVHAYRGSGIHRDDDVLVSIACLSDGIYGIAVNVLYDASVYSGHVDDARILSASRGAAAEHSGCSSGRLKQHL